MVKFQWQISEQVLQVQWAACSLLHAYNQLECFMRAAMCWDQLPSGSPLCFAMSSLTLYHVFISHFPRFLL